MRVLKKSSYVALANESVAAVAFVAFAEVAALEVEAACVLVASIFLEGALVHIQTVGFVKAEHVALTAPVVSMKRSFASYE